MEKEPLVKLTWHGKETAEKIPALLDKTEQIQITLAPEYHHVLFRTLKPQASGAQWEELDDLEGDPDLLQQIARIDGLGHLAGLTDILNKANAKIRFQGPATIIIVLAETP